MIGPKRLEEIAEKASKAFWLEVAKELPDCNPNDLDHGTIIVLQWQMKDAIERFIAASVKAEEEISGRIQGNPDSTGNSKRNGHS